MKKSIMDEAKVLGRNLKRTRQAQGLTQKELGRKVGLTGDSISKIERSGQNIGVRHLVLISRELAVGIDELFMEDPATIYLKLVLSEKNLRTLDMITARLKKMGLFKIVRR